MTKRLFSPPALAAYDMAEAVDSTGYQGYAHYNYLRSGIIPYIKRRRFEIALNLASDLFGESSVIDFGCADGVLLPSLSNYFRSVVAIDEAYKLTRLSQLLIDNMNLTNVTVINNYVLSRRELLDALPRADYKVMFLLETLEHVGSLPLLYESKIAFLDDAFDLLAEDATIVASVPKMIGVTFLAKYLVQRLARQNIEHYSIREVLSSGLFRTTERVEEHWTGGH